MAKTPYEKERELQRDVARTVESALPGVEVLALELTGKERFCVYVDHPTGVDHALCERVTDVLRPYLDEYCVEVSSPGLDRPLRTKAHFERAVGRDVRLKTETRQGPRHGRSPPERGRSRSRTGRAGRHTVRRDRAGQSDRRRELDDEPGDR